MCDGEISLPSPPPGRDAAGEAVEVAGGVTPAPDNPQQIKGASPRRGCPTRDYLNLNKMKSSVPRSH